MPYRYIHFLHLYVKMCCKGIPLADRILSTVVQVWQHYAGDVVFAGPRLGKYNQDSQVMWAVVLVIDREKWSD